MKKAILFDLDGTLLPMDTEKFILYYIKELAGKVAHLIDPQEFSKLLWNATHAVIKNVDEQKRNEEVFQEAFLSSVSVSREEIWPIFDTFYAETFPQFSHLTEPNALAPQVVQAAIDAGYTVVVATNPLFPRVAIEHRLAWAGVKELPFAKVTVYEDCHFTKPHLQYYKEICTEIGVEPEDCIMVGNDMQEDMVASKLGMKTFLVEGYVIDRGEPQYQIDDRGSLAELLERINQQQGIFK